MGTNYYLRTDVCPCCGRAKEHIHVGKSSVGWPFLFRGYREWPPDGVPHPITSAHEWRQFIEKSIAQGGVLYDEYDGRVNVEEFWGMIAHKQSDIAGPISDNYRHGERRGEWYDSEGYRFCDNAFS